MTGPTVVLLSGGLDSAVLLATELAAGTAVAACVAVDYGQRHRRELESAQAVAHHYGVPLVVVAMPTLSHLLPGGALTDPTTSVPHEHYADPQQAATVVPGRNALLLSAAVSVAAGVRANRVVTAVHAGDHAVYPDCRPEFIAAFNQVARLGTAGHGDVGVEAPFADLTKRQIVQRGLALGSPLHLTWSCYEGDAVACGRCGACVERREAFRLCGATDPAQYQEVTR